mmetsp:Transcript_8422/g.20674  ORF Transcript_8422/g.20674 Transcript_8422/m.20674 type:complete len:510 (-) Transcript_8422:209-1738(-)
MVRCKQASAAGLLLLLSLHLCAALSPRGAAFVPAGPLWGAGRRGASSPVASTCWLPQSISVGGRGRAVRSVGALGLRSDGSDAPEVEEKGKAGVLGKVLGSIKNVLLRGGHKEPREIVSEHLVIDREDMIGDGTYGEVFGGAIVGGEYEGKKVVCKRAKDWEGRGDGMMSPEDVQQRIEHFQQLSTGDRENAELAYRYLEIEAFMNDLVMNTCPDAAAPYLGVCMVGGVRWLVWEHVGDGTLEEKLVECDLAGSLRPLADAIGLDSYRDDDVQSLSRLVNRLAQMLLQCCYDLEVNGIAHRDVKPYNLLMKDGRLVMIDFGSAAAMGEAERTGYDWHKSPCDPRYAPPEQFIDEVEWAKYDLYCVGLILVRVLFPPLWCGEHFDEFADSFHQSQYDLDTWLRRLISEDNQLARQLRMDTQESRRKGDVELEMDTEYVVLAEESCVLHPEGKRLNMCSIKEGLEVLNLKDSGICWATLRSMIALEPASRLSTKKILSILSFDDKAASYSI